MLILLPPSEGKAAPARRGKPVDLDALSLPELTPARQQVLAALVEASGRTDALSLLTVGPRLAEEVARNLEVTRIPARPALEVYTGVLYAALDYAGLSPGARRRANTAIRVQSALWGSIGPTDRIPPYRLPVCARLPGLGTLEAFWRDHLTRISPQTDPGVIVDCRSSSYQTCWRPGPEEAARTVAVRVLTETDGKRTVVSHLAKHTRGLVARRLLEADRVVRTPQQVAEAVGADYRCELVGLRSGWRLDVITSPHPDRVGTAAPRVPGPA